MNQFIPLSVPNFEGNEKKYVDDALEQGWVSTGGAYITKLEKNLSEFIQAKNVAACQSGTAALHLALVEAGIRPGDVVLVPPLTFIAAVNPVKYQFATPVFIDCDDSFCLDPVKLERFCKIQCVWKDGHLFYQEQIVKAVVVVHIFGNLADMSSIMKIANKYHLQVIEDATEALGSRFTEGEFAGYFAGTIGDYGAYSFNGNKIITTGGGGAVTARNSETVNHMRYLSTQAKNDPLFYIHDEVGYNYRMTNLQAALGVAQLECLPEFIRRKEQNYRRYQQLFQHFDLAKLVEFREGTKPNFWFYSLQINRSKISAPIRDIIMKLQEVGIQTRAIWGLINEQKPYRGECEYEIERAREYADSIINIPCSTNITEEEIDYTAKNIQRILEEYAM